MYAGTTLRTKSGRIMGVHQRIDRVARRHLAVHIPKNISFPSYKQIIHYEGLNGPDGIKRKSPGVDEPWHFTNPKNLKDDPLTKEIDKHIANLAAALASNNNERAAFEAAWMAHAVTDGLTPAHHYPLEDKLIELRGGEAIATRNSKIKKIILPGKTVREVIKNNWDFWGAKGIMTSHFVFELGVASVMTGARHDKYSLSRDDIDMLKTKGFSACYHDAIRSIDALNIYTTFCDKGWTNEVAKSVKSELVPQIINTVALGWYEAIVRVEQKRIKQ